MTEHELFAALVALCQEYGITDGATYEHLRDAVATIQTEADPEDD